MNKKIDTNKCDVHTEKITNIPFDDVICHSNNPRKYFTIENNDIIYTRLKSETSIENLPYLGPCVDFGTGDICLEEGIDVYKFYVIDRNNKLNYEEFSKIEDAIQKLISYYIDRNIIDNPTKMEKIFYETLNLKKENQE